MAESGKTLFVPPDFRLRDWLREKDIPYLLCYPENSLEAKKAYHKRFLNRGNSEDFIDIFIGKWDSFIDKLENDWYGEHIIMKPDQFLSDVIKTDRDYWR